MRVKYEPVCYGSSLSTQPSWICPILSHKNFKYISVTVTVIGVLILYLTGVITFLFEVDFTNYTYPLEISNLKSILQEIDQRHKGHDYDYPVNYSSVASTIDYHLIKPLHQFENIDVLIDVKDKCSVWNSQSPQDAMQDYGLSLFDSAKINPSTHSPPSLESSSQGDQTKDAIKLLIVVKSAVNNFRRRQAIRKSWYLNQLYKGFAFKTVFVTGACHEHHYIPDNLPKSWSPTDCMHYLHKESRAFGDILQGSFIDTYYNNTWKTYLTMRWINDNCYKVDYVVAIDDDYFLETDNLLKYLRNATLQRELDISQNTLVQSTAASDANDRTPSLFASSPDMTESSTTSAVRQVVPTNLTTEKLIMDKIRRGANEELWAGYARMWVPPLRAITSKWYISHKDYRFNKFPPFITGGITLMSRRTITDFYYATYFTKAFKFDDVYVGMIAFKLDIRPRHSDHFMWPLDDLLDNPLYTEKTERIAIHDIDPDELVDVWAKRQRSKAS